jgi:hypothetical protein
LGGITTESFKNNQRSVGISTILLFIPYSKNSIL